jgi:hypothetical protein
MTKKKSKASKIMGRQRPKIHTQRTTRESRKAHMHTHADTTHNQKIIKQHKERIKRTQEHKQAPKEEGRGRGRLFFGFFLSLSSAADERTMRQRLGGTCFSISPLF